MMTKKTTTMAGLALAMAVLLVAGLADGQSLVGGHHKCSLEQEGNFVNVTMPEKIVARCKCINGIVDKCQLWKDSHRGECEAGLRGCHYVEETKKGVCAEVCKGCVDRNGTGRISGEKWGERCKSMECFSGVVTSSTTICPTPMCADPITLPGDCCPSCDGGCLRGGQRFSEGETKPDIMDPCNECTCKAGGNLNCVRRACPVLPCVDSLVKFVKGQCCPECSRRHEATVSRLLRSRMCLFRGKVYRVGSAVKADPCTNCTCGTSLSMECEREVCDSAKCSDGGAAKSECCRNSCSTMASEGELPALRPRHCVYQGTTYASGESWKEGCTQCSCEDGETNCFKMECPRVECPGGSELTHKSGHCCPSCEARQGVCTVFGDPHYRTFDGRIFNFQGSCKYLLAKDCASDNSTFSIRITNDARDSLAFSWLRTVTVRLGGVKVSLMQKMKVKVDGKRVTLPHVRLEHPMFLVIKDGYRIVFRAANTGKWRVCSQRHFSDFMALLQRERERSTNTGSSSHDLAAGLLRI